MSTLHAMPQASVARTSKARRVLQCWGKPLPREPQTAVCASRAGKAEPALLAEPGAPNPAESPAPAQRSRFPGSRPLGERRSKAPLPARVSPNSEPGARCSPPLSFSLCSSGNLPHPRAGFTPVPLGTFAFLWEKRRTASKAKYVAVRVIILTVMILITFIVIASPSPHRGQYGQ